MTSTKIEWSFNKIQRLADSADLAEMLFPGNKRHQHAFLVIWFSLKWAPHHMVPNLTETARRDEVSRRTFERVRAKMRRMGLVDHISRFNAKAGYREGWTLSTRFERSLRQLADKMHLLKEPTPGQREKDTMLLDFSDGARQAVIEQKPLDQPSTSEVMLRE